MPNDRCAECGGFLSFINSETVDGKRLHREGFGCKAGLGRPVRVTREPIPGSVAEKILSRPPARRGA